MSLDRLADAAASPDWGVGRYENVATQLLPAAGAVVDVAAPGAGRRVLDLGCGTGNAAFLAASRGAEVVGVDPSPRLIGVARDTALRRGLDIRFLCGDAANIPLPDHSADLVLSVFGLIFASEPTK